MDIRLAEMNDLEAIVSIYNSTVKSGIVTADTEPVSIESRLPWFEKHSETRPLWVGEREGEVIGWLSFEDFYGRPAYARTAEISIYIHEKARSGGLGDDFLVHALRHAPGLGIRNLAAFIFKKNIKSINLFRKHQFEVWGNLPAVAVIGGDQLDLTILGRQVW